MSSLVTRTGRPLVFPPSLATDAAGVIIPRPMAELAPMVGQIALPELLPFVRRLINGTAKRKRQPKWAEVNRQRLELAKLCIDRAMREGVLAD